MKKTCWLILFFMGGLLFFCPPAFCAQAELDQCVSKLEKKYEAMNDFQARFEQETLSSSIKQVQRAEGSVYFKKGGKMLWDYKTPAVQKIILDGQNLWFYLPEEKQVMKNNFSSIPSHIVLDLFRGKINIQERFKVTFIQEAVKDIKKEIVTELIPLTYNPTMKKLTLWIDPKTYYIFKSSLEDDFGNLTTLKFLKMEVDKGIDDSIFTFVPPAGVDVFEPPQL